jgi:hypothetical protein
LFAPEKELMDRAALALHGLEPGAVADGLQDAVAVAVELLVAQRLAITAAVADAQPAVAAQARGGAELRDRSSDPPV